MADKRISQLVDRGTVVNNDVIPIVVSGATTTNKATISSIQTFMQGNLDVGVTSVGITLGSTGTDINVTGSPVTSSGNITINIPTASATNRGLLSSANWTTFNNKVSSVGLSMPSAFAVANSPITGSGTIAVTGAGTVAQYIRGDGSLADFPEGGGGGSAVNYYLNGSVSQGTIGGIAYREINKVPILGAGTDFTIAADGYIASFITDAGDPALLEIPEGNWNFESYFSASSGGGSPSFYIELYKVNSGGTATLIASNSATPELISFGTSISPYFSPLAVPTTVLTVTDRLAVRYYVTHSGRTITLHTENSHLCQIITTFTTGLTALNGLTAQVQNFATGTSGTDFAISSTSATHTFNLPDASASARGVVTTGAQTIAGNKTTTSNINVNGVYVGRGASSGDLFAGIAGNTSVGSSALLSITTGYPNTALGSEALRNITTGANNIAIGSQAGKIDSGSGAANATSSTSIYIGNDTKPQTNGNTNEIVIGHGSEGNGSNTVTIGNSSTTLNKFFGTTLSDAFRLPSDGGGNQITIIENIGTIHEGTASINKIGFNNSNNIYFGKGLSDGGVLTWSNSEVRSYTLPNVSGIIALTANLTDFVTLSTVQTITAEKTFSNSGAGIGVGVTNSGSGDGVKITHSAGRAFNIQSSGAGFGVIINNETASTSAPFTIQKQGTNKVAFTDAGAADFSSSVTASSFVKSSGTSTQFLKADGSVDSSTYLTTGTAASTYLPLAGGTLTGALNGTSATMSGSFFSNASSVSSFRGNWAGANYWGIGPTATNHQLRLAMTDVSGAYLTAPGDMTLLVDGAATFSSSVTANGVMSLSDDGTYGSNYKTLGFTGNTNGNHRIFAGVTDGMFICSKTGEGIFFRANGGTTNNLSIASTGAATFSSTIGTVGDITITKASAASFIANNTSASGKSYRLVSADDGKFYIQNTGIADLFSIASTGAATFSSSVTAATESTITGTSANSRLLVTAAGVANTVIGFNNSGATTTGVTNNTAYLGVLQAYPLVFTTDSVERMRITSGGNVLVGTASDSAGVRLKVAGGIIGCVDVYNNTTGVAANMQIDSNGFMGRSTVSSIRFKEEIEDWTGGLDIVMALKPRTFKYKKDYYDKADVDFLGLIAEEVSEVCPYLVDYENEDRTGQEENVRYANIVVPLIKAIQELKTEIDSLKNQMQ